jgi:hypothetical protein
MDGYKELDKLWIGGIPGNGKRKRSRSSIETDIHAQNKFATILNSPKTGDDTKLVLRIYSTVIEVKHVAQALKAWIATKKESRRRSLDSSQTK